MSQIETKKPQNENVAEALWATEQLGCRSGDTRL
jgi:hypothetical protein